MTGEKKKEAWGYDLYPERKASIETSIGRVVSGVEAKEDLERTKCEMNVYRCIKRSPLVRLMMGALKGSGCPLDLRRHVACEVCDRSVSGGYDPQLNQIVVCQNVAQSEGIVQGVLAHEMVHMFDYCRKELDFKNMEHLACTEIRAANLTHCSFLSAFQQGDASFANVRRAHRACVKTKAVYSVLAVRQIERDEAVAVVNKVFPKCYADLEPVGRRLRRSSNDMHHAYLDGFMYGYEL